MSRTVALAVAGFTLALATPGWSLGPPVRSCTSAVTAGPLVAEIEARREGGGPVKTSITFSFPMVSAEAPGGGLVPAEDARRILRYGAANGEFSFRILETKWLEGPAGRLTVGDGWSITTTRWSLPLAQAAPGRPIERLEVLVGGRRYTFGVRERLDIEQAPAGMVRPGLVPAGVTGDVARVFEDLKTAEVVDLRAVDAAGAPVVRARFEGRRFADLVEAAKLDAGFAEASNAPDTPCERTVSDVDEWGPAAKP